MCGIAGIWNLKSGDDAEAAVGAMLDAMQHRGPDGRGTLAFDGGAAGMVRLALVDLSDRGQQPLWSADRRVAIIFNGEIYNFRSERERLEKAGFRFRTTTDTEVILNLYLERGIEFVDRLRGMFALAIFDWRESSVGGTPVMLLARGPLGIKPLYVAAPKDSPNGVIFASEVRGLLASGLVPRSVDPRGLAEYLARGFVIQPQTIIAGVRMLDCGTLERYAPGKPVERRQFWRIPAYEPRQETLDQAAERLRGVLEESVALHAFADAPVGAFLSGGVDSSGIVGMMREHIPDLRTYTLRFPDLAKADESDFAIATAKALSCRNTVVEVRGSEMVDLLPEHIRAMDQPSIDGLNTWLISRSAARDVKAVLSGVGGDEWFAGYPVTRRMAYYATHPIGRLQAMAGKLASRLESRLLEGRIRQRAHNLSTRRSPIATWLHAHHVFRYDQSRRMAGLSCDVKGDTAPVESYLSTISADFRRESPIGLACLLDFGVYMGNQLLRDSDVMSMAHSLELRTPLVDVEVAKFSRTCLDEFKLRFDGGFDNRYTQSGAKRVLIQAMRDVLPADIATRPKRGFALPLVHWLRTDLMPMVVDACDPATIARRGLIDPAVVAPLMQTSESVAENVYPRLWSLTLFELWCRNVLDAPIAAAMPGDSREFVRASSASRASSL
ncbi:MAG TPA: asparagine synthase (glutamine-hydrolyzing) [Pirellulales bacterium]|nr:asparagine synthase (glutamine-hydrolyzing) [Pirellulales bacterium]